MFAINTAIVFQEDLAKNRREKKAGCVVLNTSKNRERNWMGMSTIAELPLSASPVGLRHSIFLGWVPIEHTAAHPNANLLLQLVLMLSLQSSYYKKRIIQQ